MFYDVIHMLNTVIGFTKEKIGMLMYDHNEVFTIGPSMPGIPLFPIGPVSPCQRENGVTVMPLNIPKVTLS